MSRSPIKTMRQFLIAALFLTAFILRLSFLEQYPPVINRDEAAIGYNAFSLLKTGRDEWGERLPLAFKSFGDFKMPAYIYATTLPVKLFGLSAFSVRFWSALAGGLAVIFLFLLAQWLFGQKVWAPGLRNWVSMLSILVLTFNPWHFYFSRMGFEANLNLTLFLGGVTALVYGWKRRWLLPLAAVCFVLMFFTYSSSFIFLPPFLVLVLAVYRRNFLLWDRWQIVALLILLIGGSYAAWSVSQVSTAKASITIFSDPGLIDQFNNLRSQIYDQSPWLAKLWYNRPFFYGRIFVQKYLASFSPVFLFWAANTHPWHQVSGMGHFYWSESIFLILGLVFLLARRNRVSSLLLVWLLIAPLPSAITIDAPHATRMLQIIPVLVLLVTLGWWQLWQWLKKGRGNIRNWVILILAAFYFFQVLRFAYLYFIVFPKNVPAPLLPGIKETIFWLKEQNEARLIVFGHPKDSHVDDLYVYVAFYTQYEPKKFQQEAVWRPPDLVNLTEVEALGNYRFWLGVPEVTTKAFYVLPRDANPPGGFSLRHEVVGQGKTLWGIYSN